MPSLGSQDAVTPGFSPTAPLMVVSYSPGPLWHGHRLGAIGGVGGMWQDPQCQRPILQPCPPAVHAERK